MRKPSPLVKYGPMLVGLSCLVATCMMAGGYGSYSTSKAELMDESLFIVPQANVLTGAGQRPEGMDAPPKPSAHTDTTKKAKTTAAAKKNTPAKAAAVATKPVKKAAPKWSIAQKAVEKAVAAQMATERAAREARFQKNAAHDYAQAKAAALKHERHRQLRFKGNVQMAHLRDEVADSDMAYVVSNKRSKYVSFFVCMLCCVCMCVCVTCLV
jgi:hypothetical protein